MAARGTDAPVTLDEQLDAWEQANNFYSMRRYYQDNGLELPTEDIYLATMLSPASTIQIQDKIYKIDFVGRKVYYITATQQEGLYNVMVQDPSSNESINYFYTDEEVLDKVEDGDLGTPSPKVRDSTDIASRCFERFADRNKAAYIDGYDTGYRLDCKLVYQKAGIYFSLIGEVKSQQKSGPFWVSYQDNLQAAPTMDWKRRCGSRGSDYRYRTAYDNKITVRPFESTNALTSYDCTVEFASTGSGVVRLHIDN